MVVTWLYVSKHAELSGLNGWIVTVCKLNLTFSAQNIFLSVQFSGFQSCLYIITTWGCFKKKKSSKELGIFPVNDSSIIRLLEKDLHHNLVGNSWDQGRILQSKKYLKVQNQPMITWRLHYHEKRSIRHHTRSSQMINR